ncbi:MAG: ABC transporter permease [Limnochordales bacterium]|nr:ABC transporter permease [Limnochordales bacterium]
MHGWAILRLTRRWWNLLAVLQVAAGVAAITAIGSNVLPVIWQGTGQPQILSVRYDRELNEPGEGIVAISTPIFRDEDLALVRSELSHMVAAADAPENAFGVEIEADGRRYIVERAARIGPDYLKLLGVSLVEGSFFTDDDFRQAADLPDRNVKVAVISRELARILFGTGQAVGKTITVLPENTPGVSSARGSARVIGVVEMPPLRDRLGLFQVYADLLFPAPGAVGSAGANKETETPAPVRASVVPEQVNRLRPQLRTFTEFYVRTTTGDIERVRREIIALLTPLIRQREAEEGAGRPTPGLPPELGPGEIRVEVMQGWVVEAAKSAGFYLGTMALIALVVAGIALFTVTLVNLAERRHSIGLRRALGASRWSILRETVDEALVVAGAGGLLGVALSEPVGRFLLQPLLWTARSSVAGSSPWQISPYLDVRVAVLALVLTLAVGAIAVLYPAWESSRLQPMEAYRDGM